MNKIKNNWVTIYCIIQFGFIGAVVGQETDYPNDYLNKDFHKTRREALRGKMAPNSVAVIFSNPVRNRSNDVDYVYHQDPDFFYLTGYREPNSVLLIFSDPQQGENGDKFSELIFCQKRDAVREMWDGKRLGVEGVKEMLGIGQVFTGEDFEAFPIDFGKFDKVYFFQFKNDVRDNKHESSDLYSLIEQFKDKASFPVDYDPDRERIYAYIKNSDMTNTANVLQHIAYVGRFNPKMLKDPVISAYMEANTEEGKKLVRAKVPEPDHNLDGFTLGKYMTDLREIKLPEEINLLKKAVLISCVGQVEVMKAMHPEMSETEIQGIHEFVFKKYNAENIGYPSIVGAGANGCVLHYITNNRMRVGNDLVLMDLGAEYRGYTADVTRTIPGNGKFTIEQKAIYDLVYEAQEEAFKICKPGQPIAMTTQVCRDVINKGLAKLGVIESPDAPHNYFPHGVSHHIGLDVHDRGNYEKFEPNMVLTVEPGIYIPPGSPCEEKWWGIGVRIEDDILITDDGYELLSDFAPRKSDEIEEMMKEKSIFSDYKVPELEVD